MLRAIMYCHVSYAPHTSLADMNFVLTAFHVQSFTVLISIRILSYIDSLPVPHNYELTQSLITCQGQFYDHFYSYV